MNEKEKQESIEATTKHQRSVERKMAYAMAILSTKLHSHDESKLHSPELEMFSAYGPKLKGMTYDADPESEYQQCLTEMRMSEEFNTALKHHYKHNDHHPEYFENGIADMTLMHLIEMICDWIAASERHDDGNVIRSIEQNKSRFGYGDVLAKIFANTVKSIKEYIPEEE